MDSSRPISVEGRGKERMEKVTKGYKLKRVRNLGKNPADGMDYMRNFQESLKPWEEIAGICPNKKARILYRCFFSFWFFFLGNLEENIDASILLSPKTIKNKKIHACF